MTRVFSCVFVVFLLFLGVLSPAFAQEKALSVTKLAELMKAPPYGEKIIGKPEAPVTIVEYASLTCSHCADFHEKVLPRLKEKYLDTGKAKLHFRGFSLNALDTAAQMLTHCAGEEKYFPLVSAFFATQQNWTSSNDPVSALLQISKQAGFTKDSFEKCLRNQKLLDEINTAREKGEKEFGVDSTPTFFVNGVRLKGISSFEEFDKFISAQLKSKL